MTDLGGSDDGGARPLASVPPMPNVARPGPARRQRIVRHPWRVVIVVGALLLVANLVVVLDQNADTSQGGKAPLPATVESISPERGALTTLHDTITVNLENDLTGVLIVDGQEIPEDQLDRVPELGEVSFRPGPDKIFSRLRTGDNEVAVLYWSRTRSRPAHPASFSWRFRAGA
jgi:hypothetical protein